MIPLRSSERVYSTAIVVITLILFFQILVLVRDAAATLRAELIQRYAGTA